MQKYIDDLAKTEEKNIDLNDLDRENEEAREWVDEDVYNNFVDHIKVQDDDEEEENKYIKMYEEDENNSPQENKEDEVEYTIYCISINLVYIIFWASHRIQHIFEIMQILLELQFDGSNS